MIAPDLCPACGGPNRCGLADPRTAMHPCWCFTVDIDPAALAALPEAARDRACLCATCAAVTPVSDAAADGNQA